MIKRLKKVGNSNAVILDKALMELVGLKEGGAIELVVNEGSIILSPVNPNPITPERFEACLERITKDRHDAFRRLAE